MDEGTKGLTKEFNGFVAVKDMDMNQWFDDALHAGLPHHVIVFAGHHAETFRRLFGQRQQRASCVGDAGADQRAERARERLLDKPRQGSRQIRECRRKRGVTVHGDQFRPAFGMCE